MASVLRRMAPIAILCWALPFGGSALGQETFTITVTNAAEVNRSVEIRDVVCGNEMRFRDRMEPGASRTVRICATAEGTGEIVAIVATGCASATPISIGPILRGEEINL